MRATRVAMVLVLGGLTACSNAADTSDAASGASLPSATPPPSEAPVSQEPSADAAPSQPTGGPPGAEPCPEGEICSGIVGPGTYTTDVLGPTITLELADEWQAHQALPDVGFDLQDPESEVPAVISVVDFNGTVFDPACPETAEPVDGDATVAALMTHLESLPSVTVTSGPEPVTVAGIEGTQIDLEIGVLDDCGIPLTFVWQLPEVGDFHFNEGERVRIIGLEVGEDIVVIVAETFAGADHEAWLATTDEVLGSMTIEPAP
jgi:hypothetical protein